MEVTSEIFMRKKEFIVLVKLSIKNVIMLYQLSRWQDFSNPNIVALYVW
jgi:hypothetical protein